MVIITAGMKQAYQLSIIILTWNSDDYIFDCLRHLTIPQNLKTEIIIVDNGSKNYHLGAMRERFPYLNILELPQPHNLGFARACNIGADHAAGEWLAFLNADAFPDPDWLEKFMVFQKAYPNAGAFGSLVIQQKQPNLVDSAGDVYNINGIAWKGYGGYPVEMVPTSAQRIFAPCAAAAFYKRDVFLEIGGFDPNFFSYFEDVDLGFRLNLFGHHCIYMPGNVVRHVGSSGTGKDSDFAVYHYHRNMVWSFVKNMPGLLFWLYLPLHLIANIIIILKTLKNKRGKVVWKAKVDAIKGLRRVWKQRRIIQRRKQAGIREINQLFDKHLLLPFLVGHKLRKFNSVHAQEVTR